MKTVYLRIGADKAGTVSITKLASRNQDVFTRYGVFALPKNCIHLFELIRNRNAIDVVSAFNDRNSRRRTVAEEFFEANECGNYRDKDVLLVTETLWGRLAKRNLESVRDRVIRFLGSIRTTFPDHQVKVVLHLRRIDLYLESLYKQEIKGGNPVTLDTLRQAVTAERAFSFFCMLEEAFGLHNLIVKPFERSQLHNGCVVKDMLHTMGLSDRVEEFDIVHGNEGLHRDLLETLILMNQRYGKITSNSCLLQISSRLEKEFGFKDVKHLLGRSTREELLEEYAEFYSYLAKHYGNDGPFFQDPLPDDYHLGYELDPERAALIEQLVLEKAVASVGEAASR